MSAASPSLPVAAGRRRSVVAGYATAAGNSGESVCSISCFVASRWLPNTIQKPRGAGKPVSAVGPSSASQRSSGVVSSTVPTKRYGTAALPRGLLVGVRVDQRRPQHPNPLRLHLQHRATRRPVHRLVADPVPTGRAQATRWSPAAAGTGARAAPPPPPPPRCTHPSATGSAAARPAASAISDRADHRPPRVWQSTARPAHSRPSPYRRPASCC